MGVPPGVAPFLPLPPWGAQPHPHWGPMAVPPGHPMATGHPMTAGLSMAAAPHGMHMAPPGHPMFAHGLHAYGGMHPPHGHLPMASPMGLPVVPGHPLPYGWASMLPGHVPGQWPPAR